LHRRKDVSKQNIVTKRALRITQASNHKSQYCSGFFVEAAGHDGLSLDPTLGLAGGMAYRIGHDGLLFAITFVLALITDTSRNARSLWLEFWSLPPGSTCSTCRS